MIISAPTDYREAARRRVPRFVFDYIDGGSYAEHTLRNNVDDLGRIALRQRVLKSVANLSFETEVLGQKWALPVALGPVGATGLCARRGEVQAARAAAAGRRPLHAVDRVDLLDRGNRPRGRWSALVAALRPERPWIHA
jgi:L-lactate dehydrogenase (cytochrome)